MFAQVALVVAGVAVAGCGDDDDSGGGGAAAAGTCEARDDLQAALGDLADVNVVDGGTSAVEDAIGEVDVALDDLRDAGQEAYNDEIDDVQSALDELSAALSGVGEDPNRDTARDVGDAASDVITSIDQLLQSIAEEC